MCCCFHCSGLAVDAMVQYVATKDGATHLARVEKDRSSANLVGLFQRVFALSFTPPGTGVPATDEVFNNIHAISALILDLEVLQAAIKSGWSALCIWNSAPISTMYLQRGWLGRGSLHEENAAVS